MADPFLGEIRRFAFSFPPKGWASCDGRALPINQNQALYSLLGKTYGGDETSFALPDLRARTALHQGGSAGPMGSTGGRSGPSQQFLTLQFTIAVIGIFPTQEGR